MQLFRHFPPSPLSKRNLRRFTVQTKHYAGKPRADKARADKANRATGSGGAVCAIGGALALASASAQAQALTQAQALPLALASAEAMTNR